MNYFFFIWVMAAVYVEFTDSVNGILDSDPFPASNSTFEVPSKCLLPPDSGPCQRVLSVHFYNSTSGECETFTYGGCGGNDNNFYDREYCEEVCKGIVVQPEENDDIDFDYQVIEGKDKCEYPKSVGPCRAGIPQYYFNGERCEAFIYGGCGGNPNRFNTKEECMERCEPKGEGV